MVYYSDHIWMNHIYKGMNHTAKQLDASTVKKTAEGEVGT